MVNVAGEGLVGELVLLVFKKQISPIGEVTTLAGSADRRDNALDGLGTAASFLDLKGIALDGFEQLLVTDRYKIRQISQVGEVVTVAGKMEEKPDVRRPTQSCPFQFQLTHFSHR